MSHDPNFEEIGGRWQYQLEDYCKKSNFQTPTFHIFSDRRGGRTAWSSTVKIQGRTFAARYWYDGPYLNNAREDAAEVVIKMLDPVQHKNCAKASPPYLGQLWPQQRSFWFGFDLAWLESVRVVILFDCLLLLWWCCDCFFFAITPYLVASFSFCFFSLFLWPFSYASFSVLFQSHATNLKRHRHLGLTEVCTTIVSIAGIFSFHQSLATRGAGEHGSRWMIRYVSRYMNVPRPTHCGSFSLSFSSGQSALHRPQVIGLLWSTPFMHSFPFSFYATTWTRN